MPPAPTPDSDPTPNSIRNRASAEPAEQRAQLVDRVGLAGVLVGPVALHPREAQRDGARVAGGGLDAVDRDLDDKLGADEDSDALGVGLQALQLLRLPGQELIGE